MVVLQLVWLYLNQVSTAVEIEAALERLPAVEQARVRARLFDRTATKPKTGAERAMSHVLTRM